MLQNKISNWLTEYLTQSHMDCFVIGISGGIDSALVSTLCAQTGKKTIVVSMPIHQQSDQLERAYNHIKWLKEKYPNVESHTKDLSVLFDYFKGLFGTPEHKLALANSRSRLRMVTLYQIAGMNKGLVVGTGNKVEDFGVGFFTKYGDGGVDISPIGDLTKTEVREMARELGIIEDILVAKPTDGLWDDDRTDEDQMGATYEELEWAMNFDGNPEELVGRLKKVFYIYKTLNKQNKHKMVEIPVYKK
jgi:NAD+ synthase